MKKALMFLSAVLLLAMPANASWNAVDRVDTVGKNIITKNNLPSKTTFKVVDGVADNSTTYNTSVICISKSELLYTGNDNEVAAVIATEIGHIINGKSSKDKLRNLAKTAITSQLSSDNILKTASESEFVANKTSLNDNKEADINGLDLMINAGYNPLAMIVVITKHPGSTLESVQGKPANSERAMNAYDYLTYNFPAKVKSGYNCQEYKAFLAYADPIVKERNSNKKKLDKFNKEQQKNKEERAKKISKYQATGGVSGWDASYMLLQGLTE